jgi:hypothetical protein
MRVQFPQAERSIRSMYDLHSVFHLFQVKSGQTQEKKSLTRILVIQLQEVALLIQLVPMTVQECKNRLKLR